MDLEEMFTEALGELGGLMYEIVMLPISIVVVVWNVIWWILVEIDRLIE